MGKNQDTKKHLPFHEKKRSEAEQKILLKRKKIIALISFVVAVALFIWLGYYLTKVLLDSINSEAGIGGAAEGFKKLVESNGSWGVLVAFGIQVLQVVVSPIPGEVIEVGMGLCFGWFWGAIICLLGGALAAAIIMLFVKKLGIKVVELFVSTDKINELKFINNEKKLTRFVFLLYLIPGTPKDPLIFFFGLTRIRILDFVIISTVARIPSIVSSTIGGTFLVDKNYIGAIILFVATGACALVGLLAYKAILKKLRGHKEESAVKKDK